MKNIVRPKRVSSLLLFFSVIAFFVCFANAETGVIQKTNFSNVSLAAGYWVPSAININDAPDGAVVTNISVEFSVQDSYDYVDVGLYCDTDDNIEVLGNYVFEDPIDDTITNISAFNGEPVNQSWAFVAGASNFDEGYIDDWTITITYEYTPVTGYCSAGGSCDEYIYGVELEDMSNVGTSCSGYSDYSNLSANLTAGQSYELEIIPNINNGSSAPQFYTDDWLGVWIDWNHDEDFADAGEEIFKGAAGFANTITINVPVDANAGATKMRTRIVWTGDATSVSPCGTTTNGGEVEDYTVNVLQVQQKITISGYVKLSDGRPVEGVQLEVYNGAFNPSGHKDISDANGYYEIEVSLPWSGFVNATDDRHNFAWPMSYTDVTTDKTINISATYYYSGGWGFESDPFLISTPADLNEIGNHPESWDKHFLMTDDIDLSQFADNKFNIIDGPFTGVFDGAGFSVFNLQSNSGLFGEIKNAIIKNLGVENVEITDVGIGGALCNTSHGGRIENCFSTGNISGFYDVGGLCAWAHKEYVIKFPGISYLPENTPVIKNCYSTVNVTLVHPDSLPEFSTSSVGGLCAYAEGAELSNNYACGRVDGTGCDTPFDFDIISNNGGLVGTIKNCNVYNNYSSGQVVKGRPYSRPGGFCGRIANEPNFAGNLWDNVVNPSLQGIGNASDSNVIGKSTIIMQTESTFTDKGWDFENVWRICDGTNYPRLQWEPMPEADLVCPDGVNFADFAVLADQWMLEELESDIVKDGIVDFKDWAVLAANNPDATGLAGFVGQWLQRGTYTEDIAPAGGDGDFDIEDMLVMCEQWLEGTE